MRRSDLVYEEVKKKEGRKERHVSKGVRRRKGRQLNKIEEK